MLFGNQKAHNLTLLEKERLQNWDGIWDMNKIQGIKGDTRH